MRTEALHSRLTVPSTSRAGFREAVLHGLSENPKTLPCKYLYDAEGSRLFEQICEVDEYYPTRTERIILESNVEEISECCGSGCLLVELGSGSSKKTRLLLDHLATPAAYVPIDIAEEQLSSSVASLTVDYPDLEILPLCADYHGPVQLPATTKPAQRTVVFFPGSTIGNLAPKQAENFLSRLSDWEPFGLGVLIGVDLQKAREVIEPAYNDAQGVTAAFNLNLLRRINRELGADFNLDRFQHRAFYNEQKGRVEMHLVSVNGQTVQIDGGEISFLPGEPIITEYSYKYPVRGFTQLAGKAGFEVTQLWTDPNNWFAVMYLEISTGR